MPPLAPVALTRLGGNGDTVHTQSPLKILSHWPQRPAATTAPELEGTVKRQAERGRCDADKSSVSKPSLGARLAWSLLGGRGGRNATSNRDNTTELTPHSSAVTPTPSSIVHAVNPMFKHSQ